MTTSGETDSSIWPSDGDFNNYAAANLEAMSGNNASYYFHQIGRVAFLTKWEDKELGRRIEAGLYANEKLRAADETGELLSLRLPKI